MKIRWWPLLLIFSSLVALAAEEAPPADLLKNMDFYQNMNMVRDQQFLAMADTTTVHPQETLNASK